MRHVTFLAATFAAALYATATSAAPGVTDDKIVIGGTNAMTGPVAAVCSAVTHGAQAWFHKVNEAGGVHGRMIDYVVLDDAYSAQRAVGNTRRLVQQDDVFAMFGGCGTATAAGVLSFLKSQPDVPYLFPYAGLRELLEPLKPGVFALMPLYDQQLVAILPYVIEQMDPKPKTGAILSNNIAGVEAWREASKKTFDEYGIELVYDDLMEVTSPERAAFVVQMKAKNPDLAVIADAAPGGARIYQEMKRQGWKPKMSTGIGTFTAEQFLSQVSDVAEGILIAPGFVVPPTDPAAAACNAALKVTNPDIEPNHFSVFGCLTAAVLVEAFDRAGRDLTREKLIAALESMDGFETGISGPVTFSSESHLGLDSVIPFGVKDGNFVVLGSPIKAAN
ncbi:MAG: ABC transporter substrate-binding protein [Kiloniellales bacterium]